jgi:hypothetical protein
MKWLPSNRRHEFMVADRIAGFHPKAMFWKDSQNEMHAIIGSSNLTPAAFETNYEANMYSKLGKEEYAKAKEWIKRIEKQSLVVSEDWLDKYREMPSSRGGRSKRKDDSELEIEPLVPFKLPRPHGMSKIIGDRRQQLASFEENKESLIDLFRRCDNGEIASEYFYVELQQYWSFEVGDRLQGKGWEIKGKHSDFKDLSRSVISIVDATNEDRDDIVVEEIDRLCKRNIPTRGAFLSEMLCLMFPNDYPLMNEPVQRYLADVQFKAPRGASEGVRFLDLAKKLRFSLLQNPKHPAKNLAELDAVIWLSYHDQE